MQAEQPVASYGNPQVEDGYTKIANELLDAIIRHDFSKRQYKIVFFVLRKTYGWNKKADVMSLSQILEGTGLRRDNAGSAVNELIAMNVLYPKQVQYKGQLLGLNKKYKEWKCTQIKDTVLKTSHSCTQNKYSPVLKTSTTKDTSKTTTKESRKTSIPSNFSISERVLNWAKEKGHYQLDTHLENFILACEKGGLKYSNWDSAFMTAIRDNWAGVKPSKPMKVAI